MEKEEGRGQDERELHKTIVENFDNESFFDIVDIHHDNKNLSIKNDKSENEHNSNSKFITPRTNRHTKFNKTDFEENLKIRSNTACTVQETV